MRPAGDVHSGSGPIPLPRGLCGYGNTLRRSGERRSWARHKPWIATDGERCHRNRNASRDIGARPLKLSTVCDGRVGRSYSSGYYIHCCHLNLLWSDWQFEKAAEQFTQAVQLDPANDQAYSNLAGAYQNLNQFNKAEETYERAIGVRPEYSGGYTALGVFYFNQAEYAEAQAMFEKAVATKPDSYRDYSNLGGALLYENKDEDATRALEKSIAIRPAYDAYTNLAVAYLRLRKFDQAALTTQEALKLDDSDYQTWGNLGDCYYYGGHKASAMEAYKKAISMAEQRLKVNPRDTDVMSDLASYWAMLGDRTRALGYLDRALAGTEKDKELLFRATLVYNQLHETGTALEWLSKALAAGYSKSVVSKTPDLDNLRDSPRYQALMQQK